MKEYKFGYLTNSNVVEVIGSTSEEKLNSFLNKLEKINFNEYPQYSFNNTKKNIETSIKSSEDIKKEFQKLFNNNIVDLSELMKFIYSGSSLVSVKVIEVLDEYINLFNYRLYFSYDLGEFGKVYRAIMLLGTNEERKSYNEISKSLVGNTKIIKIFNKKGLVDLKEQKEKDKVYKFGK